MSHLVENMAYVGQEPWHGLGYKMNGDESIEQWIVHSGMNFEYLESPVTFQAGGVLQTSEKHKVLYRSDNLTPMGVVSNKFHVVQPREVLEFYEDLVNHFDFKLETAGVLQEGKKVWALARTGDTSFIKGNDQVDGYLLLATGCDGSLATTAQFTSVRVVCNNTLQVSINEGIAKGQQVKVEHRTKFDAQAVKSQLGLTVSAWDDFMYRMKALANRKVTTSESDAFFEKLFTNIETGVQNTQIMNQVKKLYEGAGMGSTLESSQGTAWGLVNAVTEYSDHHRRARSNDNRLNSAWFGVGATLKQKALNDAMMLVAA